MEQAPYKYQFSSSYIKYILAYLHIDQSLGQILYLSFHYTGLVAGEALFKTMASTKIILRIRGRNSEDPRNLSIYFQFSEQKQLHNKDAKLKETGVFKVNIYWILLMQFVLCIYYCKFQDSAIQNNLNLMTEETES